MIINRLGLRPHPEGGWYRETFRDGAGVDGRARSTLIYYLLKHGEQSAWHRIDAVEVWHWYAGAPLRLSLADDGKPARTVILGADIAGGEVPQMVVPVAVWQAAASMGEWTLVGCQVAPGFEFSGFDLAPPDWRPPDA
jgi:uncharacterized protein